MPASEGPSLARYRAWKNARSIGPFVGLAASFVVGVSGVIGGLFAWGIPFALITLAVGAVIIIVASVRQRKPTLPSALSLRGFAYNQPTWLLEDEVLRDNLLECIRACIVLLAMDRTESGFWGNTYVYRRILSKSGIPACGGSLTGSPLVLLALSSCIEGDLSAFREWAYRPISATIAANLSSDGNYILEYHIGTAGDRAPVFEPLRHAAGGLLMTLLLGEPNQRDVETLRLLTIAKHENMGWSKGVIFRVLIHASYQPSIPRKLRRAARRRSLELYADLVKSGEATVSSSLIWADPYDYGTQAKSQWMTLWMILSALALDDIPRDLRSEFEVLLRRFLEAQGSIAPAGTLLPAAIDQAGNRQGEYVFGSAVATAAWSTLATVARSAYVDDDASTREALRRLTLNQDKIIESPSMHPPSAPTELEGYFAWAAICLAGGTLGVRIGADEFRRCLRLAEILKDATRNGEGLEGLQLLVRSSNLFGPSIAQVTASSAGRLGRYATVVRDTSSPEASALGGSHP